METPRGSLGETRLVVFPEQRQIRRIQSWKKKLKVKLRSDKY